jgi:hypothetical protein
MSILSSRGRGRKGEKARTEGAEDSSSAVEVGKTCSETPPPPTTLSGPVGKVGGTGVGGSRVSAVV